MLEARGFHWILSDFSHLDDSLFQPITSSLMTWSIPNETRFPLSVGYIFWLSRLDFSRYKLLESLSCPFSSLGNFLLRRPFHGPCSLIKVFSMRQRDKVLELGLYIFAFPLTLLRNSIISDVSFTVYLESKCISRRCFLSSHFQGILSNMALGVCTTITYGISASSS